MVLIFKKHIIFAITFLLSLNLACAQQNSASSSKKEKATYYLDSLKKELKPIFGSEYYYNINWWRTS